jgi:hypothetical protein
MHMQPPAGTQAFKWLEAKKMWLQACSGHTFASPDVIASLLDLQTCFQLQELFGDAWLGFAVAVWLPWALAQQAARQRQQEEAAGSSSRLTPCW